MSTRPPGELADLVRICTHCALSRGWRPPKYSKVSGIDGASQIEVRPNPLRDGSVQVNEKCSPRLNAQWVQILTKSANSPGGLVLTPEPPEKDPPA